MRTPILQHHNIHRLGMVGEFKFHNKNILDSLIISMLHTPKFYPPLRGFKTYANHPDHSDRITQ